MHEIIYETQLRRKTKNVTRVDRLLRFSVTHMKSGLEKKNAPGYESFARKGDKSVNRLGEMVG